LSLLELQTLYSGEFALVGKDIASHTGDLDLSSLSRLGGTSKVATQLVSVSLADLTSTLTNLISEDPAKNIAITDYADLGMERSVFHTIKSGVKRSVRFVSMDTSEHELLMLSHQHVSEFNIIPQDDKIVIAKTIWIYDAQDWVSRDRNKPYRDIKRGMLPPKVARIMVNLATAGKSDLTLADPFCGTGTVLSEAIMVGCNVIGSDTNPDAIPGTKSNLEWLLSTPGLAPRTYNLAVADATHFDESFKSVDCIATEPYMGPLLDERNPSSLDKIKNIAKGLGKLYRGCLKAWSCARIVISLPTFQVYGRSIATISLDSIASLGYNIVASVPYSKPGGIVVRNITILEKK
jgi:tRNA G10  N-methylase Trm11